MDALSAEPNVCVRCRVIAEAPQHALTSGLNRCMDIFDESLEALLTAREHQTILAALRFWHIMVLSPSTPSPERVLGEVIPIAAAAGTPLSLAEAEGLVRRMERLWVCAA
ncbi:hypothetical protein JMJ55_04615 [Belnapia sp. T6]|uniref:Uncharacterized protein n=1 Tax=Belnapia mucosa TaxID=2804532 RepID=A0ABS1V0J8_9PROT|nr:hypothetical protein [Belnapia mucosa]MBL6454596.1 hypothetical protein [Belnapia mucosa]